MSVAEVESHFPYDSMVVSYDVSSIRSDYDPNTFLPKRLKPRGGKAKNSLFEEIDENLYEPEARMIAFHTKLERILPWIKSLDIFYEYLGEGDKYNITWYDEPSEWVQSDNSTSKCVVVEVCDKQNSLKYKLKCFVTTGTLQVQGNEKDLFSKYHFNVLKNILNRVLDTIDDGIGVSEETVPKTIADADDTDLEILDTCLTPKDKQKAEFKSTREKVTKSDSNMPKPGKSTVELDDIANGNKDEVDKLSSVISKLEDTFVKAVQSLSQSQSETMKRSIKEVEEKLSSSLSKRPETCKDKSNERTTELLKERIRSLEEDKRGLQQELQFQKQRNSNDRSHLNALMEQKGTNHEQEKKHLLSLLDQEKMMRASLQEQYTTLLAQEKQLHSNLQNQFVTLLADANYKKGDNRKMSDSVTASSVTPVVENVKPSVLLVGTSNIAKINESKITSAANVSKVIKYTIDETKECISMYEDSPDVVVLHPLTNDIKNKPPSECVDDMKNLTDDMETKWPESKIILSLATPRKDSDLYQVNTQVVNALLKRQFIDNQRVTISDNDNMLIYGQPNEQFLDKSDGYHLSDQGVSKLAANIN